MYFRKSELADVLSNSRKSPGLAMPNDFLVKGIAIENHSFKKTAAKETEIAAWTAKKKSLKEMATSRPVSSGLKVQIVNKKTESQREGKNAQVNMNTDISPFKMYTRELQKPRSGARLLRNQKELALYNLCASMEYPNEAQSRKQIESPVQSKHPAILKHQTSSDLSSSSEAQEMVETGKDKRIEDSHSGSDGICQENRRLARACSAREREKNVIRINGKSYSTGSAEKLKALNCALSRRCHSVDQAIEDPDYQALDYEYILRFKTLSRLQSRICDNSVIDAVAKENSANTVEALSLPPVLGSSWKLKNRYVSELSFNPPTPVLREYTRISQVRVVDFSDLALGSQVL